MPKLNDRGVVHLLLPLLLIIGIIAGVFLITNGNPLKLFSKASNPPIVFKSSTGQTLTNDSNGVPTSPSASIKIEFTSTLGSPIGGVSSPVSGPTQSNTKSYRFAENPTDLNSAVYQSYTSEPTVVNYTFKDPTAGQKFIWVDFLATDGRTDRQSRQIIIGTATTTSSCTDLALNKKVTSSGYYSQGKPEKAVDGSDSTMWQTNRSSGAWIYVDLGSTTTINQVKTIWFWDDRFGKSATSTIQVSTDAKNWKDVVKSIHTKANNKRQKETLNFTPVQARYVRFYGNSWNFGWADMQVFEVYNTDCNVTPTSSPTQTSTLGGCIIRDSYTSLPVYNAPDSGKGYAKFNLGSVSSLADAKTKCTDAIYNSLMTSYCSTNTNPVNWGVATYNSSTNNYTSSTCASSGCDNHSCPVVSKRVFVTSTSYSGNLGGLSGADAKCQDRANIASLGGTWKAWLSDSATSANSRLTHSNNPYKLLNGTTIANNWNDLIDGTLINKISVNELGSSVPEGIAWTGTTYNGGSDNLARNCKDWKSAADNAASGTDSGLEGYNYYTDSHWTNYATTGCVNNDSFFARRLYCFEQ